MLEKLISFTDEYFTCKWKAAGKLQRKQTDTEITEKVVKEQEFFVLQTWKCVQYCHYNDTSKFKIRMQILSILDSKVVSHIGNYLKA